MLKTFERESKSLRDREKIWRVGDEGSEYHEIRPGHHDSHGTGDAWDKGDVWVVRYHHDELEDGVGCVSCGLSTATIQDRVFLTNEGVRERDLVIWYRASFDHSASDGTHASLPEIVGPDLVPSPWWTR